MEAEVNMRSNAMPREVGQRGTLWVVRKVLMYAVLIIGAIISLFPFYYMFMASTLTKSDVLAQPPKLLPQDKLFENIDRLMSDSSLKLAEGIWNSVIIAVLYMVLSVFIASLSGYAFAKYKWRGRDLIFGLFLATLMIPSQVTYVPLFKIIAGGNPFDLVWLGTIQAVILPGLASPFGIFLMRQSMGQFPDELMDAGRIDGAGEFGIFWRLVLPVMRPSLAALAVFMFMSQWNNFFWPLVAQVDTIPTRIGALSGASLIDYSGIMTVTSLSVLPIMVVFLLMQREFISGALAGSVKG
ncbi:carbohydrate ABC transporter permease [Candidatus Chlorohelix allophototropha]|uniref:Carbohydrate ABC transporter permease n=2 Tax=Candidatus Chlorohelix allophototropha TaxID=3003348 RepID=A0ABY9B834_9CHLR|nr:carbohydrate ABC transporter permease [Chloroflexota bacterium L227-S17]